MPQSDRHGPRLDDQLDRDGLQHEGLDEAPPPVHRDESDDLLDRRSQLAQVLAGATYPAGPPELLVVAERAHADEQLLAALGALPAGDRYDAFGAVWSALGGPDVDHPEPAEPVGAPARRRKPAAARAATPAPAVPVRFDFEFDAPFGPVARVFGVTRQRAWVELGDGHLEIRFGPWRLQTPLENVAGCEITGPYRLTKVIGPPHLSLVDRGVTFATSRRRGVCIRFHDPVPAALPANVLPHPAATVTVADPEALVAALLAH